MGGYDDDDVRTTHGRADSVDDSKYPATNPLFPTQVVSC